MKFIDFLEIIQNETGASRVFLKAPFFHENFSHPFYGAGYGVLFLT